jgi:hypothetical protein
MTPGQTVLSFRHTAGLGSGVNRELAYVREAARDARDLLNEFEAAVEQHGSGIHRDPVLRDLRDAVDDLYSAARDARNEDERALGPMHIAMSSLRGADPAMQRPPPTASEASE